MRVLLAGSLVRIGDRTGKNGDTLRKVRLSKVSPFLPVPFLYLGLALGFSVACAKAQDPESAAARSTGIPAVTLGRPKPITAVAGGAPQEPVLADRQVKPVAFFPANLGLPKPLVRAQSADTPQPLVAEPALESDAPPLAKPANDKTDTTEKLGPPRRMPDVSQKLQPHPEVIDQTGPSLDGDCDGSGVCCDGCDRWRGLFCWFPFWRRGECTADESHLWFSGEYLLWWIKESHFPALVTTSPLGTPRNAAGVLGSPGTDVLFGNSVTNEERSGGRFTAGWWFDCDRTIGIEGSYFFLGERSINFDAGSSGVPILARPFFDVVAGRESSELIAFPGVLGGKVAISSSSRLWGAEMNLRENWWRGPCWHLDFLYGFRYVGLDESLKIVEGLTAPNGSQITVGDRFGTHNNFYGGQLGLDLGFRRCCWSLDLFGKVAFGATHESVNIDGETAFAVPGAPVSVQSGGLLTQPTNIGRASRDRFAVVPEAGVKLGYQITPCMRATVGYSFLYMSDVARPGNQIDRGVNVSQLSSQLGPGTLVGPARPLFLFKGTDFWAQGINFGLEFRY